MWHRLKWLNYGNLLQTRTKIDAWYYFYLQLLCLIDLIDIWVSIILLHRLRTKDTPYDWNKQQDDGINMYLYVENGMRWFNNGKCSRTMRMYGASNQL